MCGIARKDNKAPLYAEVKTIIAKTYKSKKILSPFDHRFSDFSPSCPKGKAMNRRGPHFIEELNLLET